MDDKNLTGNARFEGFSVDLLKIIAQRVGFNYVIQLVPDGMQYFASIQKTNCSGFNLKLIAACCCLGKYGVYNPETGEWNGVVRQLIDKVRFGVKNIFRVAELILSSIFLYLIFSLYAMLTECGPCNWIHDH